MRALVGVAVTLAQARFRRAIAARWDADTARTYVLLAAAQFHLPFWATRTLLQGLVLGDGRFPNGVIDDQPDWATRGIMLGGSFPLSRSALRNPL